MKTLYWLLWIKNLSINGPQKPTEECILKILTHMQFNIRYSLGSLDPFLIKFKGHKRFGQLSKIRLQSPWA